MLLAAKSNSKMGRQRPLINLCHFDDNSCNDFNSLPASKNLRINLFVGSLTLSDNY